MSVQTFFLFLENIKSKNVTKISTQDEENSKYFEWFMESRGK